MLSNVRGWKIALIVVCVIGVWLLFGVLPMIIYQTWASGPGTLGDSFGAANSLFSAAALVGVIVSLFFQKRQLEDAIADQHAEMRIQTEQIRLQTQQTKELVDQTTNQIRQTDVAQKTARIHALLTLADFQDRMIQRATSSSKERLQQKVIALNNRALGLLMELGERFDDNQAGGSTIEVPSLVKNACEELEAIVQRVDEKMEREGKDKSSRNQDMNNFLAEVARELSGWQTKYRDHRPVVDIDLIARPLTLLSKQRKAYTRSQTREELWGEYWSEVDELRSGLKAALTSLRDRQV